MAFASVTKLLGEPSRATHDLLFVMFNMRVCKMNKGINPSGMRSAWHDLLNGNQCVSVDAGGSIERWRIHNARDYTVSLLADVRTVRYYVCRFKRVGGLEHELRLVPDDRFVAGVRLYFDGAMPGIEAR
jgi:hypothetical protein